MDEGIREMSLHSRLTTLLGIEYPIIQGGMAWTATAELVAAVSNAGGLGIIGAGHMPTDLLREQIHLAKQLTDRPFGVNLMLLTPHIDEIVQMVLDEHVPVVTTGAGNPGKYMAALKDAGIKVIPIVPSVALARRMESIGADAIIGEGMEAGGHIGELTTMVLTPQLVDAVEIPVIAAGGIADGRGVAAAFALGAEGVQVGTRFMCAEECTIHPAVKAEVIKAKDRDTVVTGLSTGHPVRVLKNRLARQIMELDRDNKADEIEALGAGKLALAMRQGDVDMGSLMAGQSAAMVCRIEPAADIVAEMMRDAESVMGGLGSLVNV
jgi:enoyl-[acyl-carrier protein] reductase II